MRIFSPKKVKQARGDRRVADIVYAMKASGADVTVATIYAWEQGRMIPGAKYLPVLADVCQVSMDYFFIDEEQTNVCIVDQFQGFNSPSESLVKS